MGTKGGNSPVKVLIEKLSKWPLKLKIFLGALLGLYVFVSLHLFIESHYYFYIAAEAAHCAGVVALLYKLFALKTCSGLSLITQELSAIYIAVRLCCNKFSNVTLHNVFDCVSLISTLLIIWMIRFRLKSSYIKELDNMRLYFVVVPCVILAIAIHPFTTQWSIPRIMMAFSMYLEAVSILPQLRFIQNAKMIETFTGYYVFALGISRFIALANWIIQIYETNGAFLFLAGSGYFWFLAAFIAEIIQSFILADFCYYYIKSFMQGQLLRKMPV